MRISHRAQTCPRGMIALPVQNAPRTRYFRACHLPAIRNSANWPTLIALSIVFCFFTRVIKAQPWAVFIKRALSLANGRSLRKSGVGNCIFHALGINPVLFRLLHAWASLSLWRRLTAEYAPVRTREPVAGVRMCQKQGQVACVSLLRTCACVPVSPEKVDGCRRPEVAQVRV